MGCEYGDLSFERAARVGGWIEELQSPGFHWDSAKWQDGLRFNRVYGERVENPQSLLLYREIGAETLEILAVLTHPEAQRQGRAQEVIVNFLNNFNMLKREVWLEVHLENRAAIGLYMKLGFVKTGERPHYYGPGGTAWLMTKTLPS